MISCEVIGSYPSGSLMFHWECTSNQGYITDSHNSVQPYTKSFDSKNHNIYYVSDSEAQNDARV